MLGRADELSPPRQRPFRPLASCACSLFGVGIGIITSFLFPNATLVGPAVAVMYVAAMQQRIP